MTLNSNLRLKFSKHKGRQIRLELFSFSELYYLHEDIISGIIFYCEKRISSSLLIENHV